MVSFLHCRECRFVAKSLSGTKKIKKKNLDESVLETNKPMKLRSRTKEKCHGLVNGGKTMYKLRKRKEKKENVKLARSKS